MTRAMVTGIAGFAGSHLAEYLLARGVEVFGLVLDPRDTDNLAPCLLGPSAGRLHLTTGDLLDAPLVTHYLRDVQPDRVYHLAALSSVRQSQEDPAATFRVNVLGTQDLLEAVLAAGSRPRVLYVSSAEAYGESARAAAPMDESRPLLPVTPYGSSKAAAERLVCRYGAERGVHAVRVRPFPHTGPRHGTQFVFPDLAQQLVEIEAGRRPPQIRAGNLDVRRDLSDVRDVVAAYVLTLEGGEPGAVYNVCSERVSSLREVLERMIALTGLRVEVVTAAERLRPHDLEVLAGTSQALRRRTGWRPAIPLEETLRDLLSYWRERQAGGVPS